MKRYVLLAVGLVFAFPARGDVRLPAIFSDHMVLARAERVPIWGQADPGENVTVVLGQQSAAARASLDGKWSVALDLRQEGPGPLAMFVSGRNKVEVSDVLIGEVWVASGQSNMEWTLGKTAGAQEEIERSANNMCRVFKVRESASRTQGDDVQGEWKPASPKTSGSFTAVGYYFARRLQEELRVPVGVIDASRGGSVVETWMSREGLDFVPDLKEARERIWKQQDDFPATRASYVQAMNDWVKKYDREDVTPKDVVTEAWVDASPQGWGSLKLPGQVRATDIPQTGIFWLRKEFSCPKDVSLALPILVPAAGFFDLYLNGTKVKSVGIGDILPAGKPIRLGGSELPVGGRLREGKNVLVMRLYCPALPPVFSSAPKAGNISLEGDWQIKVGVSFSDPTEKMIEDLPSAPELPPLPHKTATLLFNGMIRPLIPYAISGVIWYQGEHNTERAWQYRTTFSRLIFDWRNQWKQGDFPFYFCQLANCNPKQPSPGESAWAELREAQSGALSLPNTGQAVLIDIGESADPHPRNKKDVGERLASIALAKSYGKKEVPWSGPTYQSMERHGDRLVLTFAHAEDGLRARPLAHTYDVASSFGKTAPLLRNSPQSDVEGFAVCGADKKWVWANARISDNRVAVWSDQVAEPVAVRYAWADNPTCNLYNAAGLPAVPFRTDDFPASTLRKKY